MTTRRKNVIWIFGDQHRGQALSCHGDPNVRTPNIDRLAMNGADYTAAVCGFPLCCPFRGTLLTSPYPHKCIPGHEYPLPDGQRTIAHAFNANGYDTAYFGKWHCDGFKERDGRAAFHTVPAARRGGFNRWLGYDNNNSQWDCWLHGHDASGSEVPHFHLAGFETDCLTDLTMRYIEEKAEGIRAGEDAPFFCALSVQPPHDPYCAPEEFQRNYNPATLKLRPNVPPGGKIEERARVELAGYYAMIENLDWNVGRILRKLLECGIAADTEIVFFSDHGDFHGSQGQFRKTSPFAESLSIPFIICNAQSMYGSKKWGVENMVVNHVDIAPTTLGLCGIETPEWMEGFDYSFNTQGGRRDNIPDSAYIQCVIPTGHGNSVNSPWRGIVTREGWKYVCLPGQPWLLFNTNDDPYEMANHVFNTAYGQVREKLHARLREWIAETGDEFDLA